MLAAAVSDVSVLVEAPQVSGEVSPVSPVSLSELLLPLAVLVSASASASVVAAAVVFAGCAGAGGCDDGAGGGERLSLETTVEYCCISITAASSKTCSRP